MLRSTLGCVAFCALLALVARPVSAGAYSIRDVEFEDVVDVGGLEIHLSGTLHTVVSSVSDANGRSHYRVASQPQGVVGVDETGAVYRATGIDQTIVNKVTPGKVMTEVMVYNIIGQGHGLKFRIVEIIHMIVQEDGSLLVDVNRRVERLK